MDFALEDIDRVGRFWQAPRVANRPGLKAVELFDAIARGQIKAVWVMATNPRFRFHAGARCARRWPVELSVVSETVAANDTVAAGAHVPPPAAAWGEKDGMVTNSERCVSRQRAFLPPPGEAKPDWWMVTQVARRMGFAPAFPQPDPPPTFSASMPRSPRSRTAAAAPSISAGSPTSATTHLLRSIPCNGHYPPGEPRHARQPDHRFFAEGGFYTQDRKARFIAPDPPAPSTPAGKDFPFRLNTGRVRDQWHTMTRSGLSPRLGAHAPEPFVGNSGLPDAKAKNLVDGAFAQVTTRWGSCVLKVSVSAAQRRGSLFVPIRWSDATASAARIGDLVMPETTAIPANPTPRPRRLRSRRSHSRSAALRSRAAPSPCPTAPGGRASRSRRQRACCSPATTAPRPGASERAPCSATTPSLAVLSDDRRGTYRAAAFTAGKLEGCLFIGPAEAAPQWDAVKALFEAGMLNEAERRALRLDASATALPAPDRSSAPASAWD